MAFVSPAATGTGWIRLGHLSPDTPPVDVYVYSFGNSGARIGLPKVEYGDISPYETLSAGDYSIAIRAAGASASRQPVMSTSVTVIAGHAYTVAAMGPESGLRLQVLDDQLTTQPGEAAVRIIQASVKQQTVREVTCGGKVIARHVAFATVVDYQRIPPGIWTIAALTPTGTTQEHVPLYAGTVDTLVILDGAHGLEMDILQDAAGQRARELLEVGDVRSAREVTEEALRTSPNRPELLWLAADVEFADGDQQAGMCCLAKAVDAGGRDAAAISRQIRALSENQLWRTTLIAVEQVPTEVRDDPLIRAAIGDFYKTLHCYGHAVVGYGDSSGLPSSAKKRRRLSWLRSGGPLTFVRHRVDAWEESQLLSDLGKDRRVAVHLNDVPDLDSRQAQRLEVSLENAHYEWSYHYELSIAVFRWLLRLLPVAYLPVWLVLYAIVNTAGFISGPPGVVAGTAISAAVALGLAILILRSLLRDDLTLRGIQPTLALFVSFCTIAVLAEIAVAEGYDHHSLPTAGWWAWVIFGLLVLPAVGVAMLISAAILILVVLAGRPFTRITRAYCQVILLDVFLSMFLDMQSPSRQFDLKQRLRWSRQLEWAAIRISRDLLPSSFLSDVAATSADWLKQRAAGWAEALRQMQREIVVSVPGRQPKLEAKLRREIRCLATGNLAGLPWQLPPPSPSRRTTLAQKTIEILRTILVAALPLVTVLVGQALLHFDTGVFRWAIIATTVWALLNIVISLDPAIRDKIDTARSLAQTINEARKGSGLPDPATQHV